jgi:hypothetical protein
MVRSTSPLEGENNSTHMMSIGARRSARPSPPTTAANSTAARRSNARIVSYSSHEQESMVMGTPCRNSCSLRSILANLNLEPSNGAITDPDSARESLFHLDLIGHLIQASGGG